MDARDVSLEPTPTELAVYERSSVHRYLEDAEVERLRLEAALAAARGRRNVAEAALRADARRADDLAEELADLTRALDEERQVTWHEVQLVLVEAEVEAAAILAAAHAAADDILAGRIAGRPRFDVLAGEGEGPARELDTPNPLRVGRMVG